MHEGFGFVDRNRSGALLLDFAKTFQLVIDNSCFLKEDHLVIDYLLFKKGDKDLVRTARFSRERILLPNISF